MSEFWVSKKKYLCKYCDIFIADDAPSRAQHENGLRHKGNKERFVRQLYKTGEKRKRDLDEEKREMVRVDAAAQAAYLKDTGGLPSSSSSSTPSTKKQEKPKKPADPYANYSTAASLGFTDVEGELAAAQRELHQKEGRMGEWQAVAPPPPPLDESQAESTDPLTATATEETTAETKEWKLEGNSRAEAAKRRKLALGLGEVYDPGVIRVKKREELEQPAETDGLPAPSNSQVIPVSSSSSSSGAPTWTSRGWNRAADEEQPPVKFEDPISADPLSTLVDSSKPVKDEEPFVPPPIESSSDIVAKSEPTEPTLDEPTPSSAGMFRKRKAPTGNASRGRRNM